MVVPPVAGQGNQPQGEPMSREIVFVIDTSGSMDGVSIRQARASLSEALRHLRPQDRFNIIEFNSSYRALYRNPVPASRHHVQRAQEFVRLLNASGGTEMMSALRAALARPAEAEFPGGGAALRQVIFITDGAVGNEAQLFEEIAATVGDTRLFTVGIGSAPNSWFMRKAAEFGRGVHKHIGNVDEVRVTMDELFQQLSRPSMVNIQVQWPGGADAWPQRVPDLYQGQPVSIAVNLGPDMPSGEVRVSGELAGASWQQRIQLSASDRQAQEGANRGVASIWARRKIGGLLDQQVRGRPEEEVRAEVLPLALSHQLLSPYTSFVAVEEVVTRPPEAAMDSAPVPNTRPQGQGPQTYAYARSATTGPAKAWMGLLALCAALFVRALRQPEAGGEQ